MLKLIKKTLLVVMVLTVLATSLIIPGFSVFAAVKSPVTTLTSPGSGTAGTPITTKYSINEDWMFTETKRNEVGDSIGEYPSASDGYEWVTLDAPHT